MAKLKIRAQSAAVLLIVLMANITGWWLFNRPVPGQAWLGEIQSLSFAGYQPDQSPLTKPPKYPSYDQLDHDLAQVAKVATSVRTYSSLNGLEKVPEIARKYGLTVTAGAYVANFNEQGRDKATDEREVASLIQMAKRNRNVTRLVVGNEHILTGAMTAPELVALMKRVKRETGKPVSTAEIWPNWIKYPELAEAADFIAIHALPYWEGVPIDQALTYVLNAYKEVHAKYPDKPIVLSEVGWPSEGPWVKGAEPSLVNQGTFIRSFLNYARENNLEYNIVEAIDQPWKREIEGAAGVSWGVFDINRQPKFPMTGAIVELRQWPVLCGIATLLALPAMIWFVTRRRDLRFRGVLFFAALIQASASIFVWTVTQVTRGAYDPSIAVAWSFLIGTQILLAIVVLNDGLEFTEILWRGTWHRRVTPLRAQRGIGGPKVSIHVPCYNEPPQMVIETLDALVRLEYDNFEVLLIDNNTKDPAVWLPVEAHVKKLAETHGADRFRFFHLDNWPGYKAGALNFGLKQTAADAEIIAVIDSDYVVDPDWLSAMVPNFANPRVALVQSPQDYREWRGDAFKTMTNWEYAGFFAIGMVARNERNAIIQHGTMTMIRKSALVEVGGWAEWCITEDAELGLDLFEHGYEAIYSPDSFGRGLVPDSFSAYKTQRFRWAYGAVQIIKKHWKNLLPGSKVLTGGQRYHFIAGWLPWFADAAHLLFAVAAIFWTVMMLGMPALSEYGREHWDPMFRLPHFGYPPIAFMIPTIGAFVFKVLSGFFLYQARIKCSFVEKLGAAIAGMGLTHTVGRAVWQGLFTKGRPFVRTPKLADQPALMQGFLMARDEIKWLVLLLACAFFTIYVSGSANREALLWAMMLCVQALPFLAALVTSMINALPGIFSRRKEEGPVPAGAQPV